MTRWRQLLYDLHRWLCRHRTWEPVDSHFYHEEGRLFVTWDNVRCLGCGRFRDGNVLRPGETVQVLVDPELLD